MHSMLQMERPEDDPSRAAAVIGWNTVYRIPDVVPMMVDARSEAD